MEWNFNLRELFEERFGQSVGDIEWQVENNTPFMFDTTNRSDRNGTASRTVYATSTPKGGELLSQYKGKYYFLPIYLDGKLIPHGVVKLQSKKTIVETALVGQRGTVKEFISLEDYSISIRGFCIGDKLTWPEEDVDFLKGIYEKNEAIEMASAITDLFLQPEDKVVIKSLDFDEFKNTHVVAYSMELVSDSIFDLYV